MIRSAQDHQARRRGTMSQRRIRPVCELLEGRQLTSGLLPVATGLSPVALNPQTHPPPPIALVNAASSCFPPEPS
jgi:hypothetical protein